METLNKEQPLVMHIDLNSCFATIKQQACPHLRGKPLVIAAYNSPAGCVLAPSIEAKRLGIKTGMRVKEAQLLFPKVIVRTPDSALIRDAHVKFARIARDYSPEVALKSIDELVIDFHSQSHLHDLPKIGQEIKRRIRAEIGEWVSCSVGIAPNRFLAKLASSLHKPDGLDVVTHENLYETYAGVELIDLHGINVRYQARLNAQKIYSPLDFLHADLLTLRHKVFKSVVGRDWYMRLRGYEVDNVAFSRKSFGHEHSLGQKTADPAVLAKLIMKLCEKMGRRLRKAQQVATGVHIGLLYSDFSYWHMGRKTFEPIFTTLDLFKKIHALFEKQPIKKTVRKIAVSCHDLHPNDITQVSLFDQEKRYEKASAAMDAINDRYGECVATPASMLAFKNVDIDKIAFGAIKDIENLYD